MDITIDYNRPTKDLLIELTEKLHALSKNVTDIWMNVDSKKGDLYQLAVEANDNLFYVDTLLEILRIRYQV